MANGGPLKWHGGKSYFAGKFWDIALKDEWRPIHVVEPYCGGAAFTLEGLARDYPYSFCVNDINGTLMNFWEVLRDEVEFGNFKRRVDATPFNEHDWLKSGIMLEHRPLDKSLWAWAFFVRNRMSLAGRMDSFTGITRTRTRRGMNAEVSAWLTTVDGLPEFHRMLKKVLILNRPALDVIRSEDTPRTLFYCDPPYLHETRATTREYGPNEMSEAEHGELLHRLSCIKGRFMLSGYRSNMYHNFADMFGWKRHEFEIANSAAGGKTKRTMTECLWCNF